MQVYNLWHKTLEVLNWQRETFIQPFSISKGLEIKPHFVTYSTMAPWWCFNLKSNNLSYLSGNCRQRNSLSSSSATPGSVAGPFAFLIKLPKCSEESPSQIQSSWLRPNLTWKPALTTVSRVSAKCHNYRRQIFYFPVWVISANSHFVKMHSSLEPMQLQQGSKKHSDIWT